MPARNYIVSIERTMRVVESLRGERQMGLSEIAARARIVKSSVFRILYTLGQLGYVDKTKDGQYSLSARCSQVVRDLHTPPDLIRLASPLMANLLIRFKETVNLGVMDGGEVLYIHVLESSHAFRLAAHAGMRSPVHSTALGKCLLSRKSPEDVNSVFKERPIRPLTVRTIRDRAMFLRELARVRLRGFALDNGEDSVGARCVAAPILNNSGDVIAAISISGPASRIRPAGDREMIKAVKDACRQISTTLTYTTAAGPAPALRGR